MEVCQTGYYTEDFRTQEVPAGFDFMSYGELPPSLARCPILISDWAVAQTPSDDGFCRVCVLVSRLFPLNLRCPKDRGNICADCIITSVRALWGETLTPWGGASTLVRVLLCVCATL